MQQSDTERKDVWRQGIRSTARLVWIKQGLTSQQTHYTSYWRQVFTGIKTQPTVSEYWRKIGPKEASIPSSPPHHTHNNTTHMQHKRTKYTKLNTHKSTHSEMGQLWQNPIQRTVRTTHLSVLMTVQSFSTGTQNRSDNLPSYLQTNYREKSQISQFPTYGCGCGS